MQPTIKWYKQAIIHFDNAIAYIENDSITNVEKVKKDILRKINSITAHPEIHTAINIKLIMMEPLGLSKSIVLE